MSQIKAPWTEDQVRSLEGYQRCGGDLIPCTNGWMDVENGPIVQDLAHDFMLNWGWKHPENND